ncbi:hemicentin-2-like [Stylophora pistillata]|uniref:hemicentin-2-like n=1 Tax=Stylophora pistillata TaxID=50429 RepID=UPI000C047AEE|nr:hemicentin-2-like [Stylophora pistillata]
MMFVKSIFVLLTTCIPVAAQSFTWTAPPPAWSPKGADDIRTVNFPVLNGSINVYLRWNYTLGTGEFLSSTVWLLGGNQIIFVGAGATVIRDDRFDHDKSEVATLIIKNVSEVEDAIIQCGVQTSAGNWKYNIRLEITEPPEVVVSNDQDVCEGSMITLSCNATGKPTPNITWTKEGENGTDSGPLPSVKGFYVISGINRSSNGTYRCTASNGVGDGDNKTTKVIVGNSSSVDGVVNSSNTADEGYPYNLTCEASGVPRPSVSWIKVSNGERRAGKLLNFTSIGRNDVGNYTCEASNRCGRDSQTKAINVLFKPEITQFKTSAVHHKVCQNDVISLNCAADAYPPVTSYQLYENDTAILYTNTSGIWSRNMSTKGVFIYKCRANSTYGTGKSGTIPIHVYVPPSMQEIDNLTITEGNDVTLICHASGDPPLEVFWIKPDGQRAAKNVLMLPNITRNETGEYRCEATNDCGTVSWTASVDVQYGPKFPIESSNCKEYVKKDDHFIMECPVEGNPQPNITWSEGGRILSHNKSKITLKSQHIGEHIYTCTAYNGIGKPDSLTFLHVVNDIVKKDFIYKIKDKSEFTRQLSEDNKKQIEVQEKITKVIPECHKHEVGKIEFRPGSIIIYIHLSFEKPMGQEALTSMLQEAARQGRLGDNIDPDSITDVSDIPAKHKCSGLYEDDQICKTVKTLWIVVFAVVVLVFAVVIIIIIYMVHKRRKCRRKDQRIHTVDRRTAGIFQ